MPRKSLKTVDGLVVAGIAVSVALIAISGLLNFRFAYRTADTGIDAWAYGLAVALAEFIKALCPFVMAWGWRARSVLTVLAAGMFFTVASGYSLASATGYAAQHRLTKQLAAGDDSDHRRDIRTEQARVEALLQTLGTPRPVPVIKTSMETLLRRPIGPSTVGSISAACTLNRLATRIACEEYARLDEEMQRAKERDRLEQEARRLTTELEQPRVEAPAANAQVDVLWNVGTALEVPVAKPTIEAALALGFALLVELGSGFGLFLVTTPWRLGGNDDDKDGEPMMASQLGYVDTFLMARLITVAGSELTVAQLYLGYQVWCRSRHFVPYTKRKFTADLMEVASDAAIPVRGNRGSEIFYDLALRKPNEPDADDTPGLVRR